VSDVFLSYASADRSRVKPVVVALQKQGWSVWWDRTIPPGKTWDKVIDRALADARCVIVLWSRVSVDSDWVRIEADEGRQREILVPALLDDVTIPLAFRRIQAANLVDWRGELPHAEFERLVLAVREVLSAAVPLASAAAAPAASAPSPTTAAAAEALIIERREALPKTGESQVPVAAPRPKPPASAQSDRPRPLELPPRSTYWKRASVFGLPAVVLLAAGIYVQTHKQTSTPPGEKGRVPSGPAAGSLASAGQIRENPFDGLVYVWIPPGKFTMGCSPGDGECYDNERPAHEVTLTRGFWLGRTPVTEAAYAQFLKAAGKTRGEASADPNLPVGKVSWEDARQYCEWAGMRLPTEAEWEYAARATTSGPRYGELNAVAWYGYNSGNKPLDAAKLWETDPANYSKVIEANGNGRHPVAMKQANAWGLYDMLGNIREWVADWYGGKYYEENALTDPTGPPRGSLRILRGGAWYSVPRFVRVSFRDRSEPSFRSLYVGFRCAGELR